MLTELEKQLLAKLDRLKPSARTVFAAACAQRLFRSYETAAEKQDERNFMAVRAILERLWEELLKNMPAGPETETDLQICLKMIPAESDGSWVVGQSIAEDALATLAYALRCHRSGSSQEALWASRRVCEAIDAYVVEKDNIDVNAKGSVERILGHPLMQAELLRQETDIDDLLQGSVDIAMIRSRAIHDVIDFCAL